MSQSGMAVETHGHGVIVFHQESEWVGVVVPWLAEGIRAGLRAVVVATPERDTMLRRGLTDFGVDVSAAEASRHYQYLDVQAAASAFADDGVFDEEAFRAVVRSILEGPEPAAQHAGEAAAAPTPAGIRMVGEVAALLVSRGGERAALDIERLSHEMTASQPVSLQCVYAADVLSGAELGLVRQVFDLHTEVSVSPGGTGEAGASVAAVAANHVDHRVELFAGVPQSIAKVRRFVADALDRQHPPGVVLDCSLIASEMATNAYLHAGGSPFRVGVRLVTGRVRITVEDTSSTPPSMPQPREHDEGGRGVAIIDALSDRWGADSLPDGKVVWAEVLTA